MEARRSKEAEANVGGKTERGSEAISIWFTQSPYDCKQNPGLGRNLLVLSFPGSDFQVREGWIRLCLVYMYMCVLCKVSENQVHKRADSASGFDRLFLADQEQPRRRLPMAARKPQ